MRTSRLVLLLLVSLAATAELAPEVYEKMQREAPELFSIQVTDVEVDRSFRMCSLFDWEVTRRVDLKAKVVSVTRTRSGVKPGAVIEVKYMSLSPCEGWNGARPIPLLSEGDRVPAYLAKSGAHFEPAARGASFE